MKQSSLSLCISLSLFPAACFSSSPGTPPRPPQPEGGPPDAGAVAKNDAATTGGDAATAACPVPTAGPTSHSGTINTETWTADKSPYILPFDATIYGTLTIDPCAEVLIAAGATLTVAGSGKILADGLPTQRIHIGANDPAKPFAKIRSLGGTIHLSYVAIDGGGDPLNTAPDYTGTFDLQGTDATMPSQETLFVDHVTVMGSASNGVVLRDGAGFAAGSQELTVGGAALFPVSIWSRAVGGLPTGTYSGNTYDEILLPATGLSDGVQDTTTMHNRGVPYRVGNSGSAATLYVGKQGSATGLATLTIEAGVTVRVKKGGVIYVERSSGTTPATGALVAAGTAASPIVFTSAEAAPAAGDWLGIWYGLIPSATDKLDFARVEYAGGTSSSGSNACNTPGTNDAAVRIFGLPAGGAFVTNTTLSNSAGHGIDRGWRDDLKTDFLPTNTFVAIGGCKQSYPRDTSGACPSPVPCP
jgi:hypothetical protein